MQASLRPGVRASVTVTVTEAMCPAFDDVVVHHVYSTWSLAHHMELAARKVLAPHLDAHEEGIGSHLSIDHIAPTPVGHEVVVEAEAVEVDATTVVCDIAAYDVAAGGRRLVARGRQIQRVLPKATLASLIERANQCPPRTSSPSP